MDQSSSNLIWIFAASVGTFLILVVTVGMVFVLHQRRMAAQARAWGMHLLAAQDDERRRIARDLHDDVVQRLAMVQMQLADAPLSTTTLVTEIASDLRSLARNLYPPSLLHLSLGRALHEMASLSAGQSPPVLEIDCDEGIVLSEEASLAVFRVAQEALQNMRKHSGAERAGVRLARVGDRVELVVSDDGRGFAIEDAAATSFGLRSMRERMTQIGGTFEVRSAPAQGSTITASVRSH